MRKLWKELGGYDALVEYNECAVRQFILKWEAARVSGQRYCDFIKEQSSEVGINLGYINIDQYRQDIYRWYLIHPYGYIDNFVKGFKNDLKSFGFEISIDYQNKSALERLISGLKDAGIAISVEEFKMDLDRYYHRFRNCLAHKLDDKEEEKIKALYKKISKEKILQLYPTLTSALSEPGILTFDDFTLCTANLKNILDTITTDVYPTIDWAKLIIEDKSFFKGIKHFKGNLVRQYSYIRQYIEKQYGISLTDEKLQIIYENLIQSNNG